MKKEELFELGYIGKPIGNKGEVALHMDTDQPEYYQKTKNLFVEIKGTMVPYIIDAMRLNGTKATIKFKDIDSKEVAELMQGNKAFLPLTSLPKLKGNQFYFHEVIGYKVIDENFGKVGIIEQVIDQSVQAIFSIKNEDQEILIPVSDDILKEVDRKNKQIHIQAPEGLIEIYL